MEVPVRYYQCPHPPTPGALKHTNTCARAHTPTWEQGRWKRCIDSLQIKRTIAPKKGSLPRLCCSCDVRVLGAHITLNWRLCFVDAAEVTALITRPLLLHHCCCYSCQPHNKRGLHPGTETRLIATANLRFRKTLHTINMDFSLTKAGWGGTFNFVLSAASLKRCLCRWYNMTKDCFGWRFPSTISVHGFRSSTAPRRSCSKERRHDDSSSTDLWQPTPPTEQHISRWTLQTPHLTSASLIICLYFDADAFAKKKKKPPTAALEMWQISQSIH